ncbi:MAG: response regulator [Spirulinaceae cyanobacterium SM2_1_0]|nr:response regulator [Spirulinaceae cyanobacterium SM2_1_0]
MSAVAPPNDLPEILIVDDTPMNLRLLMQMLAERDYRLKAAPSGKLALVHAMMTPPDLILLDIMMPEMNGYEVCRHLKAETRTRDIPIIFISAMHEIADKVKAFEVGGVDYIIKPFHTQEVLARIDLHLQLNRSRRQLQTERDRQAQQLNEQHEQLRAQLAIQAATQAQLAQSDKLATLGQMLAGIAHEINNPVGFIAGNLPPARDYVRDLLDLIALYQQEWSAPSAAVQAKIDEIDLEYLKDDLPKLLESMYLGTERIRALSKSLRTFARADTEHQVACDLHEGLEAALLILQHRLKAQQTRSEIQVVRDYSELPPVYCYPGQLNQVFLNLMANALDALEEEQPQPDKATDATTQPQLTLGTAVTETGDRVKITIQDNGPGIPLALQAKIFERLFTTKAVGQGTGLGLAIARDIVETKHGGTLTCHSTPGAGATFTITLPLKPTDPTVDNSASMI